MTLQNNKDDSCTKPTLQSAKIVRPRKFQLNVNVKHAYYYNTSVTSGAINASEHKIQLHCVLLWWCAEDPRAWLLSQFHYLWSVFFLQVEQAGIYHQLTLQYRCYYIYFCFCHQLPWWMWHGTSWILYWPAVTTKLLNCR